MSQHRERYLDVLSTSPCCDIPLYDIANSGHGIRFSSTANSDTDFLGFLMKAAQTRIVVDKAIFYCGGLWQVCIIFCATGQVVLLPELQKFRRWDGPTCKVLVEASPLSKHNLSICSAR